VTLSAGQEGVGFRSCRNCFGNTLRSTPLHCRSNPTGCNTSCSGRDYQGHMSS